MSVSTLILTGIIMNSFLGALISLVIALTGNDLLPIVRWLLGSVSMRGWGYVALFLPFSGRDGASAYQWQRIKHYDLWRRKGKAVRRQYGKRKLLMIAAGSLLTGGAVAVSGTIGFVGLVIPHVTRLLWGRIIAIYCRCQH